MAKERATLKVKKQFDEMIEVIRQAAPESRMIYKKWKVIYGNY
jgi:hypothetical protein